MTSPDVRAAIGRGWTTAVFALGATEQHGPHLPLLVDAVRGDRLAEDVARRLGRALVAPTVRVGCSEHHMAFAGTVSLRRSTLEAICIDYCVSLARHGFARICIVPSHGGNFGPLADMLDDLRSAVAPKAHVAAFTDLMAFADTWADAVEQESGLGDRVGGHADVAESSEMLVLRPELVRADRVAAGCTDPLAEVAERMFRDGLHAVSPNGILGDARGMSEEIGLRCLERTADLIAGSFAE